MLRSKAAQLFQATKLRTVHKSSRPPPTGTFPIKKSVTVRTVSLATPRYSSSSTTMGDNSEMDYERVKSGLADNSIVLLDVRTAEERKERHGAIPGSKHIWGKLFRIFYKNRSCPLVNNML